MIDGLLKARGAIYRDLRDGKNVGTYICSLLLVSVLFSGVYGAIIGFFGGGAQIGFAAMKLPLIVVGSLLMCLPNFYIFNTLCGSRLSFDRTVMMLLCLVTPGVIILIGFAPISWFFTISSGSGPFMMFLHGLAMAVALGFGLVSFETLRGYLVFLAGETESAHAGFMKVWTVIYLLVACQMAYYFKPLMTEGPFHTGERGIFLEVFKLKAWEVDRHR